MFKEKRIGSYLPGCRLYISVLLLFGFVVIFPTTADAKWEYWNSYDVQCPLTEKICLRVKPEMRYDAGLDNHYRTHVDLGLDWKVNGWLTLGPYYRHIKEKNKDAWKTEYRPHFNAKLNWRMLGMDFSNRGRLEYRIKEGGDNESFRYRNKIGFKLPKVEFLGFEPYFAVEPFYDFDADEFTKNRIYMGARFAVAGSLKADLYYMIESRRKKIENWKEVNVFGFGFKYKF